MIFSNYGAPSYYSPPASIVPAPGGVPGTQYADNDNDYEEEDYDDYDDSNNGGDPSSKKGNVNVKSNAVSNQAKSAEEQPSYGTHSWWETSYPNYPAPPASNTW